jgi:Lar family restriction alleviation protein
MADELKPCPFCGGTAELQTDKGPTGELYGWVGCNDCDAMSGHCDLRSMQPEETHPVDLWNTRTPEPTTAPGDEAMEVWQEMCWEAGQIGPFEDAINERAAAIIQHLIDQRDAAYAKGFRAGQVDAFARAAAAFGPDRTGKAVARAILSLPIKDKPDE